MKQKYILIYNHIPMFVFFIFRIICSSIHSTGYDTWFSIITYLVILLATPVYFAILNSKYLIKKNFSLIKFSFVMIFLIIYYHFLKNIFDIALYLLIHVINGTTKSINLERFYFAGLENLLLKILFSETLFVSPVVYCITYVHIKCSKTE